MMLHASLSPWPTDKQWFMHDMQSFCHFDATVSETHIHEIKNEWVHLKVTLHISVFLWRIVQWVRPLQHRVAVSQLSSVGNAS